MVSLAERLNQPGTIMMDGATGTQLQQMGLPPGMAPDLWNVHNPEAVKKHYCAYIEAGSEAILTNSFGGTRPRLDLEGSGHLTYEVNVAASRLAKEVAGESVLVLGSMGPTGLLMQPMGELTYDSALEYYIEQAKALAEGGADALHIETLSDLQEAQAAIAAAQQTNLPVTITLSFDMHGRTMMGVKPEDAAKALWGTGVLAVGANCGRTLEENLVAITAMRTAVPEATLICKPNAGMPRMDESGTEAVYDISPEFMADYALKFARQHTKMLGACCGSNPTHIAAMKAALQDYTPPPLAEVVAENRAAQAEDDSQTETADSRRRRLPRRRR